MFNVTVKARCALHTFIVSVPSDSLAVEIETVSTPSQPVLAGTPPPSPPFHPDVDFTFEVGGAVSNLDHPIEYRFNWGDGFPVSMDYARCGGHSHRDPSVDDDRH